MANPNGNGRTQVEVDIIRQEDWVMFVEGELPPDPAELPGLLNRTLDRWLVDNPRCRVRAALPIVAHGNTMAIRVWVDG